MSQELELRRRRFEASLQELLAAVEGELGVAPRRSSWILPLVAAAAGVAVGVALRRNLPRRRLRR